MDDLKKLKESLLYSNKISDITFNKVNDIVEILIEYITADNIPNGKLINYYSLSKKDFVVLNMGANHTRKLSNFEMSWVLYHNKENIEKFIKNNYIV